MVISGVRDGMKVIYDYHEEGQWNGLGEIDLTASCNLWSLIAISPFLSSLNGLSGEDEKDNEIMSRGIKEVVGNCKVYL